MILPPALMRRWCSQLSSPFGLCGPSAQLSSFLKMTSRETKILVTDDVSDSGLEPLRDAGFLVEKKIGLSPDELCEGLVGAEGLIVRSETKGTASLMDAADQVRVKRRAGGGGDKKEVPARTTRGV